MPTNTTKKGRTGQSKPRVAVLFGGRSSEHAVSCVTAAGVLGAIDQDKYDVIPIGIAKTGQWVLASGNTSSVVTVRIVAAGSRAVGAVRDARRNRRRAPTDHRLH